MTIEKKVNEKFRGCTRGDRHRRRKHKMLRRRVVGVLFLVTLAVTGAIGFKAFLSGRIYNNEEEFKLYAENQFEEDTLFEVDGKTEKIYEYGSPISYAADYDIVDNEKAENFRQLKIQEIKQEWSGRASKEKDAKDALIVKSAVYETGNGALSVVIHNTGSREKGLDMVKLSSSVDTYLLSKETGSQMVPEQVFLPDYRSVCSERVTEYFENDYDGERLSEGWKEYVSDSPENFNDFMITESYVTFFFKEGTVADKSEGIISVKIEKEKLQDTLRSAVLERYVDPSKPMVALTYDDGPGGKSEEEILNCLESSNTVATFFYTGNRVDNAPDKIDRARSMGCEIGNHTWNHPVLTKLTDKEVEEQINKTNEAIKSACGAYPTVFRPSYGATNENVNKAANMPVIMWSVDTLDWKSRNADKIFESMKSKESLDGKIILMHSLYDTTAEATKKLVPWLKEKGYQTVTVSELIKYRYGEDGQDGKVYR